MQYTKRNGDWLAAELNNTPYTSGCSFICSSNQITGNDNFCTSGVYSVLAGANLYNWSISGGNGQVTLSGNGTSTVTLSNNGNYSGSIVLKATIGDGNSPCGQISISKTIWVGGPSFYLEEYYFDPQPIKSTISMVSNLPNFTIDQQDTTSTAFYDINNNILPKIGLFGIYSKYNLYRATATNSCGTTTVIYDQGFLNKTNNSLTSSSLKQVLTIYKIYPNPSNNIVYIGLTNQNNQPETSASISGELFDLMGQSKSKVEIKDNKANYSISGLQKGIYVLKIYINNKVETHQIAVE